MGRGCLVRRAAGVGMAMLWIGTLWLSGCSQLLLPSTDSTTTTYFETTGTTTTTATDPRDTYQYNVLTGRYDIPKDEGTRWVGVMIGNNEASRPQYGLAEADLYIEGETEGGITRIMAVFASSSHLPETLGPVRSARTPFVKLAQSMDLLYCHAGGSYTALDRISQSGIASLNAQVYEGSVYWRDSALIEKKGYEYSMMLGRDELQRQLDSGIWHEQLTRQPPFRFGAFEGTGAGNAVEAEITGVQTVGFEYDPATGAYLKYNGAIAEQQLHVCQGGEILSVQNVVVLYAPKFMENELTCDFDLREGQGIAVSRGTSQPIWYTCADNGLFLTGEDGTPLLLSVGKTYICLINSSRATETKLR